MVETAQSHPLAAAQSDPLTIDATAVGVDTGNMDYQPRVIDAQLRQQPHVEEMIFGRGLANGDFHWVAEAGYRS